MKYLHDFIVSAVIGGLLVLLPVYLAALLLLKALASLALLLHPISALLPTWLPAQNIVSALAAVIACFAVGAAVRTPTGRAARDRIELLLFGKLPGYTLFRGLTQRMAGNSEENAWQPALVEIEEALVPAFIVEEHVDGRFTVFVPSAPTPFAGAIYIISRERVHLVDIPLGHAVKAISRWGFGSKAFVAGMRS